MFGKHLQKAGFGTGQGLRVWLMVSYIFLIIAALLIVKPVRTSLFLTTFGAEQLPYVFILVASASAVVAVFYFRLASRFALNRLIGSWLIFSVFCFLVSWILLHNGYDTGWFVYAFYIWVAIFGIISASQFWLLANYVFNSREAKKIFGFLGAGAIMGGIFGGYLTNRLVPIIGTHHLLWVCIGFIIAVLCILWQIWVRYGRRGYKESLATRRKKTRQITTRSPLKLIFSSKHLTYSAGIVSAGVFVASLVDYQFNAIASDKITNEDQLTAFFGFWYSNISVVALVIQIFLTGHFLRRFGVGSSLYFLPAGIAAGATVLLFIPSLGAAVLIRLLEGGFKQSINKSGMELLALPLPSDIKSRTKTFTDTFVPNSAEGIGGVILLLLTVVLGISVQYLSIVILIFICIWVLLIAKVRREYLNSFRTAIEKRSVNLEDLRVNINDASAQEIFSKVLEGDNPRQILYILKLLEETKGEAVEPYIDKLISHPSEKIKAEALYMAVNFPEKNFSTQAEESVNSIDEELCAAAIYYLCQRSDDPIASLKEYLRDEAIQVQAAAGIAAVKLRSNFPDIRKELDAIRLGVETVKFRKSLELTPVQVEFLRINSAKVIGMDEGDELYPYLHELLQDNSREVLRAAVIAAGNTKADEFIPKLIEHLDTKVVRSFARTALSEYGDEVVEELARRIGDQGGNIHIRFGAIKVLSLLESQKAAKALQDNIDQENRELRYTVLKALNKIKDNLPNVKLDKRKLEELLEEEIADRKEFLEILRLHLISGEGFTDDSDVSRQHPEYRAAGKLLEKALVERLQGNLERIFRLLGLQYPQADIYNAYVGIISENAVLHANAIEFIDNMLDFQQKKQIIPILEQGTGTQIFGRFPDHREGISDIDDYISFLVEGKDDWLRVCVLYFMANSDDKRYSSQVEKLLTSNIPVVRETAEYTLKRLKAKN